MRTRLLLVVGLVVLPGAFMVSHALDPRRRVDTTELLAVSPADRERVAARMRALGVNPTLELLRLAAPSLGPYPGCAHADERAERAARLLWDQDPQELRGAVIAGLRGEDGLVVYAALNLVGSGYIPLDAEMFWATVATAREPDLRDVTRSALHRWRDRIPALLADSPESDPEPEGLRIAVDEARLPLTVIERERLVTAVSAGGARPHTSACRALLEADRRAGESGR